MCDALSLVVEYAMAHWGTDCVTDWVGLIDTITASFYATSMSEVMSDVTARLWRDVTLPRRLVVVAVDDASEWLERPPHPPGLKAFQLLQVAFRVVNDRLTRNYGEFGRGRVGVFGLLVDSNLTNAEIGVDMHAQMLREDTESSARPLQEEVILFPPFILTHTMNTMLQDGTRPDALPVDPRDSLKRMARPLWQCLKLPENELVLYATSKLLSGLHPDERASYCSRSMHGIAALLCHLDIDPRTSAELPKT